MANFALIKNNIVIAVIVVDNEKLLSNGVEVEQLGVDFIDSLNIKVKTYIHRYIRPFEVNYANKNFIYIN
jgi:hypothetical protein